MTTDFGGAAAQQIRHYVPSSNGKETYVVMVRGGVVVSCTCSGFHYRGKCRHMNEVRESHSVGFTGTQQGMTPAQAATVEHLLRAMKSATKGMLTLHHGLCVGSDEEVHVLGRSVEARIIGHPCDLEGKQAALDCDVLAPVKKPLDRNHDIVDEVEVLIAAPRTDYEELRSGTWATVRYAQKQGKTVVFVLPSGKITQGVDIRQLVQ